MHYTKRKTIAYKPFSEQQKLLLAPKEPYPLRVGLFCTVGQEFMKEGIAEKFLLYGEPGLLPRNDMRRNRSLRECRHWRRGRPMVVPTRRGVCASRGKDIYSYVSVRRQAPYPTKKRSAALCGIATACRVSAAPPDGGFGLHNDSERKMSLRECRHWRRGRPMVVPTRRGVCASRVKDICSDVSLRRQAPYPTADLYMLRVIMTVKGRQPSAAARHLP